MPFWLTAPALKFALKQSLSWSNLTPGIIALFTAMITLSDVVESISGLVGLFLLLYALPHAATQVIAMDRDQRLDQLRLSALTPTSVAATLLAIASGRWLVAGGLLFSVWLPAANLSADRAALIAAVIAGSFAVSLLALALPRGQRGFDARLVAVGIAVVAMMAAIVLIQPERVTDLVHRRVLSLPPPPFDVYGAGRIDFRNTDHPSCTGRS